MPIIKQRGILDPTSNPKTDADVIMTAAVVGHAYSRLSTNQNCAFDTEANTPGDSPDKLAEDWDLHLRAVAKINRALTTMGGAYGQPGKGKEAVVGVTPEYNPQGGIARITGVAAICRWTPPTATSHPCPRIWPVQSYTVSPSTPGLDTRDAVPTLALSKDAKRVRQVCSPVTAIQFLRTQEGVGFLQTSLVSRPIKIKNRLLQLEGNRVTKFGG